jgi:hypothetical protein
MARQGRKVMKGEVGKGIARGQIDGRRQIPISFDFPCWQGALVGRFDLFSRLDDTYV